ncbi:MAG: trypsin-like peptidase domain-containing protein [Verrucomicrobiota bacterium]
MNSVPRQSPTFIASTWLIAALTILPASVPGETTPPSTQQRDAVALRENATVETNKVVSLPQPVPGKPGELAPVFKKAKPESPQDLKSIEQHLQKLVPRVSPAVVAVQVGGATGSGVVITADGIVLTAAHVCDEPNREVRFTFPDGKTARGKTLGTNHEIDAGMMKIHGNGPWPHVQMGDLNEVRVGDWSLTLGHPGGFDPQRSLVVRLGRVIRLSAEALQTDCTLSAGDSGGPLFDMHGRVIGIHSRISESTAENFHVPIRTYRDTWERLARAESWGGEQPTARPWFGVRGVDDPSGCKIESVDENAPAFKAGVRVGDIIRKVNDREIKEFAELRQLIASAKPGDELTVHLQRDGKELSLPVKIEARRWRR